MNSDCFDVPGFKALWEAYGAADDSTLDSHAQELKQELRHIVGFDALPQAAIDRVSAYTVEKARARILDMRVKELMDENSRLWLVVNAAQSVYEAISANALHNSNCVQCREGEQLCEQGNSLLDNETVAILDLCKLFTVQDFMKEAAIAKD